MTCTNSHCSFPISYFRSGSAISLYRSQSGWKYVYCSRVFSTHTHTPPHLFSSETEWSNRRHSLPGGFSVDDLQLNYNTYNNNRLWYKLEASRFVPVTCFIYFFLLLFFLLFYVLADIFGSSFIKKQFHISICLKSLSQCSYYK